MTFEKRVAMPDRDRLGYALYLALAMLASVPFVPIQTMNLVAISNLPQPLGCSFKLSRGQSKALFITAITTEVVPRTNDYPAESEEQDRAEAVVDSRVCCLDPGFFTNNFRRQSILPRTPLSFYPLRC